MTRSLPVGWTTTTIAALGGTVGGKTPGKSEPRFWSGGSIAWVSPKDMKVFELCDSEDTITPAAVAEAGMKLLPSGSVLMVTRSGILAHTFPVAVTVCQVTINQDIKAILPRPDIFSSRYLALALRAYGPHILRQCSKAGTTVASVETSRLDAIPLPFPPLGEQQRIADKLDTVLARAGACRDRLARVASLLKRFRQSVLARAVCGRLTLDWRANHPEQPSWSICATREAGRIQLGRQRSPKFHSGENMRPYLRVQNVFEDRLDLSDVMSMDFPGDDFERYRLHPGDILLNEGQSPEYLGRPAMYRGELPGSCFTNTLIRFQAYEHVSAEFALLVFRNYMHSGRYLSEGTTTTNIAHLGAGRFGDVEFPLPPLAEQEEISRRARELLAFADRLEARLTAAQSAIDRLTPALLAKAFRGELVPQDPDDESAAELLKRLHAQTGHSPQRATTKRSRPAQGVSA